jgi:hypothetical protein
MIKLLTAGILAALFMPTAPATAAEAPKSVGYELPAPPNVPVIVYDSEGGMLPGQTREPLLTIRADHTVILGNPSGQGKRIETRIAPEDLQALLRFIVADNRFFEFDAKQVETQILEEQRKTGRLFLIADAPVTVIRVQLKDQEHEARQYGLGLAAKVYPAIEPLQRLAAIQKRLDRYASLVRAGGTKGLAAELRLANHELAQRYPAIKALTADDLDSAVQYADGSRRIFFSHSEPAKNGQPGYSVHAEIYHSREGIPIVSLAVR